MTENRYEPNKKLGTGCSRVVLMCRILNRLTAEAAAGAA